MSEDLEKLKSKKQWYINRLFLFMIEVVVVVGVPAVAAALIGKKYGMPWTVIAMALAVILSWTIIIFRYKQIAKKVQELEDKIKQHPDFKPAKIHQYPDEVAQEQEDNQTSSHTS